VDPSVEGSVGNGSWDLMSMGYAGFSSRGYELEEGQQVHWPALLNPIDRYRLGWIGNARLQENPGRLLVEPGQTIIRPNLSDPAELTAIQNVPNSEEHPMRYHIGADPTGQQLVFCSHRAQVAAGNTLYYRPGLMRPDTVLTDDGQLSALDDHYASWPLWEKSMTPRFSWNTHSVNDSLWRHHLERISITGRYGSTLSITRRPGEWFTFRETPNAREFRRGVADSLHYKFDILTDLPFVEHTMMFLEGGIGFRDGYFSFYPSPYGPMVGGDYTVPEHLYHVSDSRVLGAQAKLEAFTQGDNSYFMQHSDELMILLSPHVEAEWDDQGDESLLCAEGPWIAAATADGVKLRNTANPESYMLLTTSSDVRQLFFADLESDGSPELVVVTGTHLSVHRTSTAPEMSFEAITLHGDGRSPVMVVQDPTLSSEGFLLVVDGDRILVLDSWGVSMIPAGELVIPEELRPVTQACWAGGDVLGPRFALAGGPGSSSEFQLLDLAGTVLYRFPRAANPDGTPNWTQLLSGDFLNNGTYSVAGLATIMTPGSGPAPGEELCIITWSQQNEEWGGSRVQHLDTDPARIGPTAMIPFPG